MSLLSYADKPNQTGVADSTSDKAANPPIGGEPEYSRLETVVGLAIIFWIVASIICAFIVERPIQYAFLLSTIVTISCFAFPIFLEWVCSKPIHADDYVREKIDQSFVVGGVKYRTAGSDIICAGTLHYSEEKNGIGQFICYRDAVTGILFLTGTKSHTSSIDYSNNTKSVMVPFSSMKSFYEVFYLLKTTEIDIDEEKLRTCRFIEPHMITVGLMKASHRDEPITDDEWVQLTEDDELV
jgi:hypothetical protein